MAVPARHGPSKGSTTSSRTPRASSHCPNCVCNATTGTACSVIATLPVPAITALSTASHATPMIRANAALIRARRSSSRRKCGASAVASVMAEGTTSVRNTSVPNSDTSAATCAPRSRATTISSVLMHHRANGRMTRASEATHLHSGGARRTSSTVEIMFVSADAVDVDPRCATPPLPCWRWPATVAAATGSDRTHSCVVRSHGSNPRQTGGN